MKKLSLLIFCVLIVGCKDNHYSDKEKIIISNDGNTDIYYKNSFLRGIVKDSTAADFFDRALKQSSLSNYKKALELLELANQIKPNNTNILNALGNINADLKNFDKAYTCYEKALRIDDLDAITCLNYGLAKAKNDKFTEAISIYNKGLNLTDNDKYKSYLYYNLSRAYYHSDNSDKAESNLNRAIELVDDEILKKEMLKFKKKIN